MTWKSLFLTALSADSSRIHMAAHSHHLWPDASFEGQRRCWEDAATLADHKWDKVMGEVWPAAQRHVADELHLPDPSTIVFGANTHELILRLFSARGPGPLRVLSTDGEFHSFRRQAARWVEQGQIILDTVPTDPFSGFESAFLSKARSGNYDIVFVSQVLFGSGRIFRNLASLAAVAERDACWVVVDGYHAFMALDTDLSAIADRVFYIAGGYKYAMAGEGAAFMHCPPGFGARPAITGWFAAFDDLSLPPGAVGYAQDARRFMGATFDPSGLYRFVAVRDMLARHAITTRRVNRHVAALHRQLVRALADTALGGATLLNPLDRKPHARFLALQSEKAQQWHRALGEAKVTVDVRGDVLRIGIGMYHDSEDIDRFVRRVAATL